LALTWQVIFAIFNDECFGIERATCIRKK